jgi:hypothetical protein
MKTITFTDHNGQTISAYVNSADLVSIVINSESGHFYEGSFVNLDKQDLEEFIQVLTLLQDSYIIGEYPENNGQTNKE